MTWKPIIRRQILTFLALYFLFSYALTDSLLPKRSIFSRSVMNGVGWNFISLSLRADFVDPGVKMVRITMV